MLDDAGCEGGPSWRLGTRRPRSAASGAGAEFWPTRAGDGGTCALVGVATWAPAGGVTAEPAAGAAAGWAPRRPCRCRSLRDVVAAGCAGAGRAGGFAVAAGGVAVGTGEPPGRCVGASIGVCRAVGIGAFGLKVVVARWSDPGATRGGRQVRRQVGGVDSGRIGDLLDLRPGRRRERRRAR